MFGSIAKVKLKPGAFEKMFELTTSNIEGRPVKGRVFNVVFRSQSDPDELWSVVGFEDEATYRANASNPQTSEVAEQLRQLMAAPPEWHDGEIVWDRRW